MRVGDLTRRLEAIADNLEIEGVLATEDGAVLPVNLSEERDELRVIASDLRFNGLEE